MSKKSLKTIPIMGYVGDGEITKEFRKYFTEDTPVAQTIKKLSRDYYAGRVSLKKAERVLVSLGEGQKKWVKEVLMGMVKPQLYFVGLRRTIPFPGHRPAGVFLRKKGRLLLEGVVCYSPE